MDRLLSILNNIGVPYAYDHFAEGEAPAPPFLCYLLPGSDNFSADGKVYRKFTEVRLELYTDLKDPEAEQNMEDVLYAFEMPTEGDSAGKTGNEMKEAGNVYEEK